MIKKIIGISLIIFAVGVAVIGFLFINGYNFNNDDHPSSNREDDPVVEPKTTEKTTAPPKKRTGSTGGSTPSTAGSLNDEIVKEIKVEMAQNSQQVI